jgi:hypothetical protein
MSPVLKRYNGTEWEAVGAAPNGTSVPHPDNVPASPHADDQEFNATTSSLPSGWSWVNQGTSTYAEANGAGVIAGQIITGTYDWRGLVRNVPAGASWSATQKVIGIGTGAAVTGYTASVMLRQSSDGKMLVLSRYRDGNVYLERWTSATAFSAVVTSPLIATSNGSVNVTYFRIRKNSATSWDFLVSPDGCGWFTVSAAYDASVFLTPDQIGFGHMNQTTAGQVANHWYRVG